MRFALFFIIATVWITAERSDSAFAWNTVDCMVGEVRKDLFSKTELAHVAIALKNGTRVATFSPEIINELRVFSGSRDTAELMQPEKLAWTVDQLHRQMGDRTFNQTIGTQLAGYKEALSSTTESNSLLDLADVSRGYASNPLPEHEPGLNDPEYLAKFNRHSNAVGQVMDMRTRDQSVRKEFNEEFTKNAGANVEPIYFTQTGSDANNSLYDLAEKVVAEKERLGLLPKREVGPGMISAEILVLEDVYGAGTGRMARVGLLEKNNRYGELKIESPESQTWDPKDPSEVSRLNTLEARAISKIRDQVKNGRAPIGGLLFEPITGAKGVNFFRPEFLVKLRAVCDELHIPLIADEILTGGGRTGRFFAYQHYAGFEPDFVTFGKALQVSGVASVTRSDPNAPKYQLPKRNVTLDAHSEPMLRGTQFMKIIRERGLMQNALDVGNYFVERLNAREAQQQKQSLINEMARFTRTIQDADARIPQAKTDSERGDLSYQKKMAEVSLRDAQRRLADTQDPKKEKIRGMGLLIYKPAKNPYEGRIMPVLTFTRENVDQYIYKLDHP